MILLKQGNIETRWVGECRECKAIFLASPDEIDLHIDEDDCRLSDYGKSNCEFCKSRKSVLFRHLNCSNGIEILRRHGINPVKIEKGEEWQV